jgi:neutral ceramidase
MSKTTLTAGVARINITPPIGFRMQGIVRRIEGAKGIESPLLATVLVLADDTTKMVIVDCDLLGFDLPLVAHIRQTIAARINTHPECVALGCTHTHNGPCTIRHVLGGPHDIGCSDADRHAQEAYIAHLVAQLAGTAALADSQRQPARVGTGQGRAAAAINREERNEDGRILVGRNPDGTTDHSVDVLRIDALDGQPIAVLTGYAAHPVVMGMDSDLFSPDYPGVVRRIVEDTTGAICLFMTGAAGNQATLSFLQNDWDEKERMGGQIGCEAARVFFEIETRPHHVVRQLGASLSGLALYHKEFHDGPTHQILTTASRTVNVPLQPLPSVEAAEAQLKEAQDALDTLIQADAPTTQTYPAQLAERWAESVVAKVKDGKKKEWLSFDIIGFRLDDFVLVGMPGEPFVEIGLAVKQRSSAKLTFFAGYCNGSLAYWPTAETVAQGGMSVSSALKTYCIPTPPVAETADIIVAAFDELLQELDL